MSLTQSSQFQYGAFTKSSLIFDKFPVLQTNTSSYTLEINSSTSVDERNFKCVFETDSFLYLDMRDTHFLLEPQLFKGKLCDYKKRSRNIKQSHKMIQMRNQNPT